MNSRNSLRLLPRLSLCSVVAFLLLLSETPSEAGEIRGRISAQGPRIEGAASAGGAYSSRRYRFAERVDYDALRDFVVHIASPVPDAPPPDDPEPTAQVVQRNATFEPQVLPVAVGTVVSWPNRDDIYHNVFSLSDPKEFDLGFYKDGEEGEMKQVRFDKPGRVDVFCAIHTEMHCVILVLENRFFARAGNDGRYSIKNVPPGKYVLRAWHQRLPAREQEITVPKEGVVEVVVSLGFGLSEKE